MKKMIDGKLYNTDTAKFVCGSGFVRGWSMSGNHEIELYKTPRGNFFKVYDGYVWEGNSASYRSTILPVSLDEAKVIFEMYGDVNDYSAVFGEEPEEA